jgi:hypothetical protein
MIIKSPDLLIRRKGAGNEGKNYYLIINHHQSN